VEVKDTTPIQANGKDAQENSPSNGCTQFFFTCGKWNIEKEWPWQGYNTVLRRKNGTEKSLFRACIPSSQKENLNPENWKHRMYVIPEDKFLLSFLQEVYKRFP
jgi:hypothetical protein